MKLVLGIVLALAADASPTAQADGVSDAGDAEGLN